MAGAADALSLPHPVHIHGLNLGIPGNAGSAVDLIHALDGRRAHLAHVQFHSYAGDPDDQRSMASDVPRLASLINESEHLTVDVGQVLFGETTSMTADGAVAHFLHTLSGRKWSNLDVESETGCGVVPIRYEDKNYVHALQWSIGLEWFLSVEDPWKLALSTDHPNGAPFHAYPELIALLMSRNLRDEVIARLPKRAATRSGLKGLGREYTLSEIAVITRAAPARILGLRSKGHLGLGADADVTIYQPDDDLRKMFATPRYVVKAGAILIDDGEPVGFTNGRTLSHAPGYDPSVLRSIRDHFAADMSVEFENFPVGPAPGGEG